MRRPALKFGTNPHGSVSRRRPRLFGSRSGGDSSPLAHGKWGISEFGESVVLACRATEDLGWIIFLYGLRVQPHHRCDGERATGIPQGDPETRRRNVCAQKNERCSCAGRVLASQWETLMAEHGQAAAPRLLALLSTGGDRDEKRCAMRCPAGPGA